MVGRLGVRHRPQSQAISNITKKHTMFVDNSLSSTAIKYRSVILRVKIYQNLHKHRQPGALSAALKWRNTNRKKKKRHGRRHKTQHKSYLHNRACSDPAAAYWCCCREPRRGGTCLNPLVSTWSTRDPLARKWAPVSSNGLTVFTRVFPSIRRGRLVLTNCWCPQRDSQFTSWVFREV